MNPATPTPPAARRFRAATAILLLAPLLLLVPPPRGGEGMSAGQRASKGATPDPAAVEAEVHFTDDSVLKVTLRDKDIRMTTRYGKLLVPAAAVRFIEFATRTPPAVLRQIEAAIANLGALRYSVRQAASAELLELREKAYPALLQAVKHKDPEVARRAEGLIKQLRESVPPEQLVIRKDDVVHTLDSRITGRIEGESLKALTFQFGEVRLKLGHMRSLQYNSVDPDPTHVEDLHGLIGKTFRFKVTGAVDGPLFGSGIYTADSSLAAAAAHMGILKPGQTGVVRVTFVTYGGGLGGQPLNGVLSTPYNGPFRGAYMVSR
jgi:hypothetical protein